MICYGKIAWVLIRKVTYELLKIIENNREQEIIMKKN